MNYFDLQDKARRSSRRMVVLFVLAVLAVVLAVDAVAVFAGFAWQLSPAGERIGVDWVRLVWLSVAVLAGIGLSSLYRTMSLRSGGSAVARSMGATPVPPETANPAWRQLRNVIEEVAIASGVAVPDIYVMENEAAINAFAAGFSPADAAVCVTQGCLDTLTRDELQGVIAHEFSHVLNGDMRFNIRLVGLLFGILVIGLAGRMVMHGSYFGGAGVRRSRDSNGAPILLIGIGLLVIGYVGFFFGRLIQAAAARSRESLADASAVQFTRQSAGIAGALKKIAALPASSILEAQNTGEVRHMLFGEGLPGASMFATHPPLVERIKALDPAFQPQELDAIARAWQKRVRVSDDGSSRASLSGFVPVGMDVPDELGAQGMAAAVLGAAVATDTRFKVNAGQVVDAVARPGEDEFATSLHEQLPADLVALAREPSQALHLLLAMAVSRHDRSRKAQSAVLDQILDDRTASLVLSCVDRLQRLPPALRMPLASLAFPALRHVSRARLQSLMEDVRKVAMADGEIGLDEFCLAQLLEVHVLDVMHPAAAGSGQRLRLRKLAGDVQTLFSLVAKFGHRDEGHARSAFAAACEEAVPGYNLEFFCPTDWQAAFSRALVKLDRLGPRDKELVVRGLVRAIRHDSQVSIAEAEMLRVVCASLHCPLPPVLEAAED